MFKLSSDSHRSIGCRVGSELTAKLDIDIFFETLSNPFAGAVQYNRDSRPNSPYNIKYICSFMQGNDLTPDQSMQKLAYLVLGDQVNGPVLDWSYASSVQSYQETAYTMQDGEYSASKYTHTH